VTDSDRILPWLLVVLVFAAGCTTRVTGPDPGPTIESVTSSSSAAPGAASNPDSTALTSTTSEAAVVTIIDMVDEIHWDRAVPDPATVATIGEALRAGGQWTLLPGPMPPGLSTIETPSCDFHLTRTDPITVWNAGVVVRAAGRSVVISLSSQPEQHSPDCATRLASSSPWSPARVRGQEGCALIYPDAVNMLEWTEDGRRFHAEFSADLPLEALRHWLEDWWPAGDCDLCLEAAPGA
jgi:hypothetical protein